MMPFLGNYQADSGHQEQAEDEQGNRRVPVSREAEYEGVDHSGVDDGDDEDAYVYVCAMS